MNHLYYGDNLGILRDRIPDESVDLIYLDPPFNSNATYNVLFKSQDGKDAAAQIQAFDDTWHWSPQTDKLFLEMVGGEVPIRVADALAGMRNLLGTSDMNAYIVMMTARLVELHQVLKPTGSLYLHCDPTASHYLKLMLDAIFGPTNFKNEIIWRRTGSHGKVRRFGPIHDVILFYAKSDDFTWNYPKKRYMRGHVEEYFVEDENGWRTNYYGNVLTGSGTRGGESGKPWHGFDPTPKNRHWAIPGALLDEVDEDLSGLSQHQKLDRLLELGFIKIIDGQAWPTYEHRISPDSGTPAPDIWAFQPYTEGTVFGTRDGIDADVRWLATKDAERLHYPTQKPVALLERIIRASSNTGDVVLDPFCGCGTAIDAAETLGRRWIGIDITYLAIALMQDRLQRRFGDEIAKAYEIHGVPADLDGARALFEENPFDFERWAVTLIGAQPNEKQRGDKGIDGRARFYADRDRIGQALVSVKGGATVNPAMVNEIAGTVAREKAEMGILITLKEPTPGMRRTADLSGNYTSDLTGQTFPKVQIISVSELMVGKRPKMPTPNSWSSKAKARKPDQLSLGS